jgi:glutathione S-transferase
MTLKLFDLAGADDNLRFSPYCWRVKMACAHKGLPLETIPWRFTEKDRLPQPSQGTVPVLLDGGEVIADSWRILNFLDQHYAPDPLFGSEPAVGATLFLKLWTEQILHPLVSRIVVRDVWSRLAERDKTYFRETREKRLGQTLEQAVENRDQTVLRLREALEPARTMLRERTFLSGTDPAGPDYILFGVFQWARCTSAFPLLLGDDPVYAWQARMLGLFDGLADRAPAALDQSG